MPLSPSATNVVACTTCSWRRILDVQREYRGGHTDPTKLTECHGRLDYSEVSPSPIEVYVLGEPEAWVDEVAPELLAARVALYDLEDDDVDTALAAAAAS